MKPHMYLVYRTRAAIVMKFYPMFLGREDDLDQELMIVLMKCIQTSRRREIQHFPNYVITAMKNKIYKIAAKEIAIKQNEMALIDLFNTNFMLDTGKENWEEQISYAYPLFDFIFSSLNEEEAKVMKNILRVDDYETALELRSRWKCDWPTFKKRREFVLQKVRGLIRLYCDQEIE